MGLDFHALGIKIFPYIVLGLVRFPGHLYFLCVESFFDDLHGKGCGEHLSIAVGVADQDGLLSRSIWVKSADLTVFRIQDSGGAVFGHQDDHDAL